MWSPPISGQVSPWVQQIAESALAYPRPSVFHTSFSTSEAVKRPVSQGA
jgi:hypothetical protein